MRIWSVHPQYLDSKGLVALWREALLAKNVLSGNTSGYRHHPQLIRFINSGKPVDAINRYLVDIFEEAEKRGYHFDKQKIDQHKTEIRISVKSGQLDYEMKHLLRKLKLRDIARYAKYRELKDPQCHSMFQIVAGGIENWEKVYIS